jgi:hypothetical protein
MLSSKGCKEFLKERIIIFNDHIWSYKDFQETTWEKYKRISNMM